jgi:hypothetical protein
VTTPEFNQKFEVINQKKKKKQKCEVFGQSKKQKNVTNLQVRCLKEREEDSDVKGAIEIFLRKQS